MMHYSSSPLMRHVNVNATDVNRVAFTADEQPAVTLA